MTNGICKDGEINFIDRAFAQKLSGDDFLQAMAGIYSEPEARGILGQYPAFVADVIAIIDYDTALQMDGLWDVLSGSMSGRLPEIIAALQRCGAGREAAVLKSAKASFDADAARFGGAYEGYSMRLALNNDYEGFWDIVRAYIDKSMARL